MAARNKVSQGQYPLGAVGLLPQECARRCEMFIFKGCSRCRGDLYQGSDMYGDYIVCLQCGYYLPDGEMVRT